MLKRFTLVGLLFFSLLFMGCLNNSPVETNTVNSTSSIESTTTIQNDSNLQKFENKDLTMKYASNWNYSLDEYGSSYEITFIPNDIATNGNRGLIIWVSNNDVVPDALSDLKERELNKVNDYVKLVSSEDVQFAGEPAFKATVLINSQLVKDTLQTDYVFRKGDKSYKVSYLRPQTNENAAVEIENMLKTLTVK